MVFELGSMTVTVPPEMFETYTRFVAGSTRAIKGPFETGITAVTVLVAASMTVTWFALKSGTYNELVSGL
ncbi:hypothetical protein V8V70_07430 [Mesobacillus zeae]|nr:hypothetical protein [Mesobacillus zeae]